jgi:hypothetical protein
MLIIGEKQLEVFERILFEAMQRRVERAIGATFPEINDQRRAGGNEGDEEAASVLTTVVERGIENAVGVGLGDGGDFAAFIALGLALRLAPPGAGASWIHAWLVRTDMPGQTKLGIIESRLHRMAKKDPALASIAVRVERARELAGP